MSRLEKTFNHYQSITLWHYTDKDCHMAYFYNDIRDKEQHDYIWLSYEEGKQLMAKLMLRLGKMPEVTHYDGFDTYDLHGFLD